MKRQDSLTGIWHGLYNYPRYLEPVYFMATLISHGSTFSGTTHEAVHGRAGAALEVFATLDGTKDACTISFIKHYDSTRGWTHRVSYAGALSEDGLEIEGMWSIAGDWSGRFFMLRNSGACETVARKVFAQA